MSDHHSTTATAQHQDEVETHATFEIHNVLAYTSLVLGLLCILYWFRFQAFGSYSTPSMDGIQGWFQEQVRKSIGQADPNSPLLPDPAPAPAKSTATAAEYSFDIPADFPQGFHAGKTWRFTTSTDGGEFQAAFRVNGKTQIITSVNGSINLDGYVWGTPMSLAPISGSKIRVTVHPVK